MAVVQDLKIRYRLACGFLKRLWFIKTFVRVLRPYDNSPVPAATLVDDQVLVINWLMHLCAENWSNSSSAAAARMEVDRLGWMRQQTAFARTFAAFVDLATQGHPDRDPGDPATVQLAFLVAASQGIQGLTDDLNSKLEDSRALHPSARR